MMRSAAVVVVLSAITSAAWAQPASTDSSELFTASPTSGRAPLTVTFCASAGIGIDFGDGASSGMGIAQSGECPMPNATITRHTYAAAGTYRVRGLPCPSATHGASCGAAAQQASAVTITVTPAR